MCHRTRPRWEWPDTTDAHSRSDNPHSACNTITITAAIRVAGSDWRPTAENRSAYCSSGNTSAR